MPKSDRFSLPPADEATRKRAARLVGLCGHAGTGRTTLRRELEMRGWRGASFATPVRAMLGELLRLLGVESNQIYDLLHERPSERCPALNNHTLRYAMQTLGTEWGRDTLGNVWLPVARREIRYRLRRNEALVFDDLRFPDEAALIREYGGLVARIVRPSAGEIEATLADIVPDMVIINDDPDEWAFAERAATEIMAAVEERQ